MSLDISTNNKRIAKNALMLYTRMFFTMGINLYISRAVLKVLGVEDYGIYNVVGGIVTMFTVFSGAMNTSTQRYMSYSLGKGNDLYLKKVFSTCNIIHILIALLVFILVENIGIWFLYNKLVIPDERMQAAFWTLQFSLLSIMIGIWAVPYNAVIAAHEKLSAFAYISIIEVLLKLFVVIIIPFFNYDKLFLYAFFLFLVQAIMRFIYGLYCYRHFQESHFYINKDKRLFKEILSFASWNLFGQIVGMLFTQGVNIILNIFFGPVVNAARGIAIQVQGAINQFAINFQTAINPQITKSYAKNDLRQMHSFIFRSSRFTFMLLLVLTLPIICEADFILRLWLSEVPRWTSDFVKIILCIVILDGTSNSLMVSAQATGKIKSYQLIVGGIQLAILPISYIVLKMGYNPTSVFYVHFFICIIAFIARILVVQQMVSFTFHDYIKEVILKSLFVVVLASILPVCLHYFLSQSIIHSVIVIIISILSTLFSAVFVGLNVSERAYISNVISNVFIKHG